MVQMEKQLNFNQPLLSVRRGSSTTAPPPVANKKTNSTPTLPPLPYYKSELKSGPIRNAGAVPFQWEQIPGRPKNEKKEQRETIEQQPLAPKLPPGRVVTHKQKRTDKVLNDSPASSSRYQAENNIPCSPETSSVDKVLREHEGSAEEKADADVSSSEDENVTYVDARDTLSRTESFFLNCSISGVSGLDGPNMEPSGAFSDPQTRDFMMGRFLPAAKAVASETPQYASRKHTSARELPKPVKNMVTLKKKSPQYNDVPKSLPHNVHGVAEKEEEEDDSDEYDDTEDLSAKFCGLLPKFCLLNPIPGMRDHAHVISSVRSVRTRPAYAGVCSKSENRDSKYDHRGELKRLTARYGSTNVSSNGHFNRKGITPSKNGSAHSFLGREKAFLGLPEVPADCRTDNLELHKRGHAKFKTLLTDQSAEEATSLVNSAIEKTLYVDSEHRSESRNSDSSSLESRGRNPSVDYSLQDIKSICGADEKSLSQSKGSESADSSVLSSPEKSSGDVKENIKGLQKDQVISPILDIQQPKKRNPKEANRERGSPLTLVPLLPKSPSESWLSRTLPSIPSKNPSSKSFLGNPAFRSLLVDPKRDRMLKTSNGHLMLVGPSGELATILEN